MLTGNRHVYHHSSECPYNQLSSIPHSCSKGQNDLFFLEDPFCFDLDGLYYPVHVIMSSRLSTQNMLPGPRIIFCQQDIESFSPGTICEVIHVSIIQREPFLYPSGINSEWQNGFGWKQFVKVVL